MGRDKSPKEVPAPEATQPAAEEGKRSLQPAREPSTTQPNPFLLEELFLNPADLLAPTFVPGVVGSDVIVAVDTSALLLPYETGREDLGAITSAYKTLAAGGRLFLPARAAREFFKNRDRKITELLNKVNDSISEIKVEGVVSPIFEGIDGYADLKAAATLLEQGRGQYIEALKKISSSAAGWGGNDPITSLYAEIFNSRNIIEHEGEPETIRQEWNRRVSSKIPPGYLDAPKEDGGIGDFLIWKTLLRLGREKKKDLVFITGEKKADWFIRPGKEAFFPRSELLAEYRNFSGGKNLRLSSLSDLLKEFGAERTVVEDVRLAENATSRAMKSQMTGLLVGQDQTVPINGLMSVNFGEEGIRVNIKSFLDSFKLDLIKFSDSQPGIHKADDLDVIKKIKRQPRGSGIGPIVFNPSIVGFSLEENDVFAVRHHFTNEMFVGRITRINQGRNMGDFNITIDYLIFQPDMLLSMP